MKNRYIKFFEKYTLVGFYDEVGFHVAKSKDSFKQIKNTLLKNEKTGIFEIPEIIFSEYDNTITYLIQKGISKKSLYNLFNLLKNYKDIEELSEI